MSGTGLGRSDHGLSFESVSSTSRSQLDAALHLLDEIIM